MHIIVDVRTSSPDDVSTISYATLWRDEWIALHPDDRITFLAYEWDPIEHDDVIRLMRSWYTSKRLASHAYGPDRMISFSRLPPIDTSIPLIAHVWDLADLLYPRAPLSLWWRKIREYRMRKLLRNARIIIIPHMSVGLELAEIFDIPEKKMSVIPYLMSEKKRETRGQSILPHGIYGEYYITPASPGNEWNPLGLLTAFSKYVHILKWEKKLVIHWDIGENLSYISSLVRSLDLSHAVKIFSVLREDEVEHLYSRASGWIYIGPYYSRGHLVSLAETHSLPLILSDIEILREYDGIHIHPNHIDTLPEFLMKVEGKRKEWVSTSRNESIMKVYTRLIAEWNLQKS